jgi:phosphonate transport system permease protein
MSWQWPRRNPDSRWCFPTRSGHLPWQIIAALGIVVALLTLSASCVELSIVRLIRSVGPFCEFMGHLLVTPDWAFVGKLLQKMLETIEITLVATAIALVLSFPLGILAASNTAPHPWVFHATRNLLSLIRALPEMVWALVFVSAVGLGPLPGVMALALVTVGFMGKFFAESIEVVDAKAVEGVRAHGAGHWQTVFHAMLPQAMPDFVGSLLYILDHNVRAAAILGIVGAGGIGYDMVMSMRMFNYNRIVLIAVSIYIIVTLLDRLSDCLRTRVIHGHAKGVS